MTPELAPIVPGVVSRHTGLGLLLLFGSRARGDARRDSDWDFGYLGDEALDPAGLLADLASALRTDRVDLVDLGTAGGLLRFRAARDGVVAYEREAGTFARFWFEAVSFWCDAEPVLRAGYEAVLADLGR